MQNPPDHLTRGINTLHLMAALAVTTIAAAGGFTTLFVFDHRSDDHSYDHHDHSTHNNCSHRKTSFFMF